MYLHETVTMERLRQMQLQFKQFNNQGRQLTNVRQDQSKNTGKGSGEWQTVQRSRDQNTKTRKQKRVKKKQKKKQDSDQRTKGLVSLDKTH